MQLSYPFKFIKKSKQQLFGFIKYYSIGIFIIMSDFPLNIYLKKKNFSYVLSDDFPNK